MKELFTLRVDDIKLGNAMTKNKKGSTYHWSFIW